MKKIQEIINRLAPEKNAIFFSGDPGVVTMQNELNKLKLLMWQKKQIKQKDYENANGVFLRFSVDDAIYSGIIQTKDKTETRGRLLRVPAKLGEQGCDLLTIQKLPLPRIPLFPFFTTLAEFQVRELIDEISNRYWSAFKNDIESLRKYYLDLIAFRREIIFTQVPRLGISLPFWLGYLKVYVLYSEKNRSIATRYYRSEDNEDAVSVKETSKRIGLGTEEVFSEVFTLPSKHAMTSGARVQYTKEGEKVFSNWIHPYFEAVKDLKEQVIRFNRAQPTIYYDAYTVSNSFIHNWTYKDILKKRELARKFPEFERAFEHWLKPLQVLVFYFIDEAKEMRITNGIITAYYVNGPEDKIIVKRVKNKENTKWKEETVKEYFPESEEGPRLGFMSGMSSYLSEKLGGDR